MSGTSEDSFVLVGGRKQLPKLHLETEDTNTSTLRARRSCSQASTPDCKNQTYSIQVSPGGTPAKTSTQYVRRNKGAPSPTLHDLKEGRLGTEDSGYSGWKDSAGAKKQLSFDPYNNPEGSYLDSKGSPISSVWDSFTTPVLDFKKKLQGRQSFLDDSPTRARKVQPQQLLAGIIVVVMLSSICFAVLVGVTHFNNFTSLDGKRRSIMFGTEKKLETLREAGQLLDRDMVDESGELLGGKRAAIQYAYETSDEYLGGAMDKVNPKSASLTRNRAKALNHLDVLELAESVEKLKEMMVAEQMLGNSILDQVSQVLPQPDLKMETGKVRRSGRGDGGQFRFQQG